MEGGNVKFSAILHTPLKVKVSQNAYCILCKAKVGAGASEAGELLARNVASINHPALQRTVVKRELSCFLVNFPPLQKESEPIGTCR